MEIRDNIKNTFTELSEENLDMFEDIINEAVDKMRTYSIPFIIKTVDEYTVIITRDKNNKCMVELLYATNRMNPIEIKL